MILRSVESGAVALAAVLLGTLGAVTIAEATWPGPQTAPQATAPVYKQLAGPPSEMYAMAPPDPAQSATHSKSALLPVSLEKQLDGRWTWSAEIPLEGEDLRFAVFPAAPAALQGSWKVMLGDPITMHTQSADELGVEVSGSEAGLSHMAAATVYRVHNMTIGKRLILLESDAPGGGSVLVEGAGPIRLLSHQTAFTQRVGQRIGMIAHIYDRATGDSGPSAGRVSTATLRVSTPDSRVLSIPMLDDGLHHDGIAGDGIFGGDFLADRSGDFRVQVDLVGQDRAGVDFLRTSEHLIPILGDTITLQDQWAASRTVSSHRLAVDLRVAATPSKSHYRVIAEVWGANPSTAEVSVPVAWIGGMTSLTNGTLSLGLDTRWIAMSGAQKPFELRNVRVEDPDLFITVASVKQLPLLLPAMPEQSTANREIIVDEEMLQGPRPASLGNVMRAAETEASTSGTGHKLLLVHGYCSTDVWGPVAWRFDNSAVFEDFGANRSLDEFAGLLKTLGSQWYSFAIVAHSQGGMAALQLLASQWSGLDNAGPGRLIQSVGTPYRGTNIAGNWAAFFHALGVVPCGENYGLTYEGAALWLSGVPPDFPRNRVHYYTTSFTDDLGYDFCSAWTDLLLTDPDDGVTEQAWGQLPGGVNQGHTTGWCHTDNMEYPPQVTDWARDAVMNANAAVMFTKAAPLDGTTGESTTATLRWGAGNIATTYEYCIDSTNDGACSNWTSTGAGLSASPTGLSPGTTYYWQVRAWYGSGVTFANGGPAAYWSFTTNPGGPGAFSKSSPADGASDQQTNLTLTWGTSSNAESYEYCLDTTNDGVCSGWTSTGTGRSAGVSGLGAGTTYYWQVRAHNGSGTTYANGGSTAYWSFMTHPDVSPNSCANPILISSFPYSDSNTTVGRGSSMNSYSCAPTKNEGGPEVVYRFTVSTAGDLTVTVPDPLGPPDIDPHLLSSCGPNYCLARDNTSFTYYGLQPGTYYIVCDTYIDTSNAGAYTLDVSFTPSSTCTYSLCSSTAGVGSGAGSQNCGVTAPAGCAWTATSNATGWLTTSSSGTGSGTLTYSYSANPGGARTGTITVQDKTLTVTQAGGGSCSYSLDPSTATVPAEAGSGSSGVTAPSGCAWTASSNAASWLTTSSSGSGNGTVVFYFTANTGFSRTGTITAGGQTLTVTQAGASCTYSLSTSAMDVGSGSGAGSIVVYAPSGCAWAASSNATSWLTTSSSGSGNGTLNFNFTANTGAARTGTITVQGHTLTVTQATGSCTYSTCSTVNVGTGAGSGSCGVTATSGCAWTANSSATSWLTTSSTGNGNGTVSFDFTANAGASRTGLITLQDQTITVNQGTTCTYSLCSSTTGVGAGAGSSACSVTTTSSCAWAAISDSPSWLTATGSGNGNGTFSFSYTANTGASRTGTITVQEQAFMVTQAGISGCEFTQQGPKLMGTGGVGNAGQGGSVSLSSDGNTAIVGGYGDNSNLGAAWIWTRSGGVWAPQGAKLVGAGAVGNAQQGYSVALSADGSTVIVGGPYDNSGIGAAWVWTRSGGVWIPQAELVGTGVVSHSRQGWSVALSADGSTAIVGGYLDNSGIGAAWVWTRSGGVWTQQGSKLVAADAVGNALQGWSVSLSADGNTAIVGAPYDNRDTSGYGPGAAWVWTRNGGVWTKQTKLFGSGAVGYAQQGYSVTISADGNTAIVGGPGDNDFAGAAWVWGRSGGVWSPQGNKLIGSGAVGSPFLGCSVTLSSEGTTGIVGGPVDNNHAGAAWVFTRNGGVWTTQTKLLGLGAVGSAEQGCSVALSGDGRTAIVGGYNDTNWAGAAWVFACVECSLGCTATVPATGVANAPVSFQSTATPSNCTGSPTYSWNFGDGQTSTQQNPSHTYSSAATHNWSMTATVQGATCTKSGSIVISPACSLACTATAPAAGTAGVAVIFQATATPSNCTGSPTYSWSFGDGQTSAQQYPTHTYASAGTFNWSMTATVQGVICSRTGSIVISAACVLACAATVPSTGTAGVAINYAATATPSNCTGSPAFAWDFGDGQSSTQQSPSHAYTSAGTYTWSMTVTVQGVPCIKTGSIVVSAGDVNGDGEINVQDVFYLINALFAGGPAPIGSGDVNGDTQVNVSDVFYLINYLFAGGPAPV